MFLIKLAEVWTDISLSSFGLRPRVPLKLYGILTFPFLHADWLHLFSNLLPFIFFTTLIVNLFPRFYFKVGLLTFLLSGFWTWCFARDGLVIGASGWVYALLGFLLIAGFSRSSRKTMIIAGGLAFLYGGMVQGLLPVRPNISWEGHLMGLLAGIVAAFYWRKEIKQSEIPLQPKQTSPSNPEREPPYPFWLFNEPHIIGPDRRILSPDEIEWENGIPRIKNKEEETPPSVPDQETPQQPPKINHTGNPLTGYWQINQS